MNITQYDRGREIQNELRVLRQQKASALCDFTTSRFRVLPKETVNILSMITETSFNNQIAVLEEEFKNL